MTPNSELHLLLARSLQDDRTRRAAERRPAEAASPSGWQAAPAGASRLDLRPRAGRGDAVAA
jgi:hypothetical protein